MYIYYQIGLPWWLSGKESSYQCWTQRLVQSHGWEEALEEGMATHSSIHAWNIPWTREPGRPPRAGHKESDMTELT